LPMLLRKAVVMPPSSSLRFEWVTATQRFLELREQWNLLGSSAIETVFLTHDWLASWLVELCPEAELHVLTAWDGDQLAAALPLFGSQAIERGRHWMLMGTGTLTPNHLDIIAAPAVRERAREGFVTMLLEESVDWDMLEFDKLPADSETADLLAQAFGGTGLATTCAVSAICPFCDLPATYEAYVASRKKQIRKEIRRAYRWLEEQPGVRVLARAETESQAIGALARLEQLHQARWAGKGYPGAFADPRVVRFHERMVRAALKTDSARIYTLSDADEIVAVSYNYRIGSGVQGYLSSFDPLWAEMRPGVLLRSYVIEQSLAEKAARIDFLEGTEQYKASWSTGQRENLRLRVFNRTLRGRAAHVRLAAEESAVGVVRRFVNPKLRERVVRALARRAAPIPSSSDTEN